MDKIQDRLKEEEVEREEQEKRRHSVIVFGLNESCATEAEVRVADDVEKFQDIMHELEVRHESDITKVVRLGKKAESADEKPRPLKVSFSSEESKLDVLKKAKNLRDKKEGGLDKVFIYPDLTPKQREARKKLAAELKSRLPPLTLSRKDWMIEIMWNYKLLLTSTTTTSYKLRLLLSVVIDIADILG